MSSLPEKSDHSSPPCKKARLDNSAVASNSNSNSSGPNNSVSIYHFMFYLVKIVLLSVNILLMV